LGATGWKAEQSQHCRREEIEPLALDQLYNPDLIAVGVFKVSVAPSMRAAVGSVKSTRSFPARRRRSWRKYFPAVALLQAIF
jgi:hypothetical protein